MAETTITMPQLGESLTEGTVSKWLKKVGDSVKLDEPLFEVSTDKINLAVESSGEGVLISILVKEGETVKVGATLGILSDAAKPAVSVAEPAKAAVPAATAATAAAPVASAAAPTSPVASPAKKSANGNSGESAATGLYPSDPSNMISLPPVAKPAAGNGAEDKEQNWREKSSPLVRRILAENNLPMSVLDQIQGSGVGGRVTKEDALAFVSKAPAPAAAAQQPQPLALPAGIPPWIVPPTDTDAEAQPLTGIRKMIAERLTYSEHVAPHVTTFADVDVTDLVAFRAKHKQWVADEYGANLTFLPFVIRAICAGLKAFPGVNSSLIGDTLYAHKRIHIGLAVSLDQAGLILPVIKDADHLGIVELAKTIQDLAGRARSNQLKPDEIRGSTFTLSNPGAFGGWISTPIINQPNAAILNTGTIKKMPWVMPDDSIVARSIMYLSLSYDHRIVDGETSVKFLQHVKRSLENVEKSFLL
jgi:pyruvate dehydrogenase E2 component (dihydrolipoamide acetyltransferase)